MAGTPDARLLAGHYHQIIAKMGKLRRVFCLTPPTHSYSLTNGILWARILEWVAFLLSRGPSQPRDQTQVFRIAVEFFTSRTTREAQLGVDALYVKSESGSQSSQTLCDLMDCSLPGSSVHGILQARIMEWVAFPFSRGSSQPRD